MCGIQGFEGDSGEESSKEFNLSTLQHPASSFAPHCHSIVFLPQKKSDTASSQVRLR